MRHEIVHNRHVVESLEAKGAVFVEELDEVPDDRPRSFLGAWRAEDPCRPRRGRRQMLLLDATCPLVSQGAREAERHSTRPSILLIGHAGHPEVIGTMGQLPAGAVHPDRDGRDAESVVPRDAALALITQTTLSVDDTAEIVAVLKRRFPEICGTAQGRHLLRDDQPPGCGEGASRRSCDLLIVVGRPTARTRCAWSRSPSARAVRARC